MTPRQRAKKQKTDWNQAIREGRVVRFDGGLTFRSYKSHGAALEAVFKASLHGRQANIVEIRG